MDQQEKELLESILQLYSAKTISKELVIQHIDILIRKKQIDIQVKKNHKYQI
jgi:hypothetical protein|tara:strand:- start:2320 stop:2475 length:156 start_codon:yes stop_codon:yes gene_type:complete